MPVNRLYAIGNTISAIRQRLAPLSETAALDSQVLLAHVVGRSRAWVLAHPEAILTKEQERALEADLSRLEAGEPLPYVLGHWEFFGLDFAVTPAALIPRPETETLVEAALVWLRAHPGRRLGADVGTGSGCIAVGLAVNVPDLRVLAGDPSWVALQLARANARRHTVAERVDFVLSDLLPAAGGVFDLICANLPYIPTETLKALQVSQWEPWSALDGGPDGLDQIRRLLLIAPKVLAPIGLLLLEIEASQGAAGLNLARAAFPDAEVQVLSDLAGRDRLVRVQRG